MIPKRSKYSRSALSVVVCLALVLGVQSAHAGGKKKLRERIEVEGYDQPSSAVATDVVYAATCNPGPTEDTHGCLHFDLEPKDRDFMLEVQDESGQPVFGVVWNEAHEYLGEFCGRTESPIPNPGGDSFYVEVITTNAASGCVPSTATMGEVTATFTTLAKSRS